MVAIAVANGAVRETGLRKRLGEARARQVSTVGRWVSRLSWPQILAEYNLLAGRLWALVPLWVAVAPYLFFRWQAPR